MNHAPHLDPESRAALRAACARASRGGVRVEGTYIGSATGRAFHKAELTFVPMTAPHEFASVAQFERLQNAPVLVSPTQRYAMLTSLVQRLRQHVPGLGPIGVRLYGSDFDVQLSADLLAPDVLITHAPLQLVPCMLDAGRRNVAVIQHGLRADGIEQGGNDLSVWLFAPTPEALSGFFEFVDGCALLRGLRDLALEAFESLPGDTARRLAA